ncbi:MAG: class I SAM-dependent methyltransferase [Oscillospiraceae bacterium]|nr:class I SAM-dependent methyltransferase [Oscillospiraceae bacterium]
MKIVWNDRSIRWFRDASAYTGFHAQLAGAILSHIPVRDSLCDVGCGSGLIDFILAPDFGQITCVDRDPVAIRSVEEQAGILGLDNVSALCLDGGSLSGQWGTVMALFHGTRELLPHYLSLARDQMILVTHGSAEGSFGPSDRRGTKHIHTSVMEGWLLDMGVDFDVEEFSLEYGQPFTDLEDARAFLTAYAAPMEPEELENYLHQQLQQTDDSTFPYYLPNCKKVALFTVPRP